MSFTPPPFWSTLKGFLADDEAAALFTAASEAAALGPLLEIGSYCGKSTICLALGMGDTSNLLFALDHHRGSEEHQPGALFHDPELFDDRAAQMDSFREFRLNLDKAGVSDRVVPLVTTSELAARHWATPVGMVFIDGGHSLDAALTDYRCWAGHLLRGGLLAIHDVYPDAASGGQAPYAIYRLAQESGLFRERKRVNSLALLERL